MANCFSTPSSVVARSANMLPALFMRMCILPLDCLRSSAAKVLTLLCDDKSSSKKCTLGESAMGASAVLARAMLRPAAKIVAPVAAKEIAEAAPNPDVTPVIMMTLPCKAFSFLAS